MLVLVLALFVLIALGVCALVGVVLWRAGRWGIAALAVLVVLVGWVAFRAAHPEPQFYVNLFERETGLTFPASGEVVDRGASVPDNTGDYCAEAVVAIEPADAERLRAALRRTDAATQEDARVRCEDVGIAARGPYLATVRDHKDG
ncbi:MAG: hypothetical protein AAFQ43_04150, partial [Bacteroidota bacterium]